MRIEQLDVTDPGSVAGLAKRIGDVALDILINNAGIFGAAGRLKDVDPEQYGRVFEVNCLTEPTDSPVGLVGRSVARGSMRR